MTFVVPPNVLMPVRAGLCRLPALCFCLFLAGCDDDSSSDTGDSLGATSSSCASSAQLANSEASLIRCTYSSSQLPLALSSLVDDYQLDQTKPLLIEAWGGVGDSMSTCGGGCITAEGVGGYAYTWQDPSTLVDLWIYVGSGGDGSGGTASLVIGQDINSVVGGPDSQGVLVIAGGGGSAGEQGDDSYCTDDTGAGGAGGVAIAETTQSVTAPGTDGIGSENADGGQGGSAPGDGLAGTPPSSPSGGSFPIAGTRGTNGIGGIGSKTWIGYDGPSWPDGAGGPQGCASGGTVPATYGGGGGGYGGGSSGASYYVDDVTYPRNGGGGGGGSWALKASSNFPTIDPVGQSSWTGSDGQVVLSFVSLASCDQLSEVLACEMSE